MAQSVEKQDSLSVLEIVAWILWIAVAIIFPFGYWINPIWYLVALALACVGGFLFFSSRISRRASEAPPLPDHLGAPYISGDLRGFRGSKITTEHKVDHDMDGDPD